MTNSTDLDYSNYFDDQDIDHYDHIPDHFNNNTNCSNELIKTISL